jgi:hypothetical protein
MTHDLDPEALQAAEDASLIIFFTAGISDCLKAAIAAYLAHIRERETAAFSALEMSGGQGGQSAAITQISPPQTDGEPT